MNDFLKPKENDDVVIRVLPDQTMNLLGNAE